MDQLKNKSEIGVFAENTENGLGERTAGERTSGVHLENTDTGEHVNKFIKVEASQFTGPLIKHLTSIRDALEVVKQNLIQKRKEAECQRNGKV